ncbi:MAG: DUF2283 domain-containing protein [Armatimonadota bacterium]
MNISYDSGTDVLYICLKDKGKFSKSKKINENTIVDVDKNGEFLGIEVLFASERYDIQKFTIENLPVQKKAA